MKQPCCSSACFQNRFNHVAYTLCGLDSKLAVVDWTSMDFFFSLADGCGLFCFHCWDGPSLFVPN